MRAGQWHGPGIHCNSKLKWNATRWQDRAPKKRTEIKELNPALPLDGRTFTITLHRKPLNLQKDETDQNTLHIQLNALICSAKSKRWRSVIRVGRILSTSVDDPDPQPPPQDAYLAAQLAAGVDAQCPGHMLALS